MGCCSILRYCIRSSAVGSGGCRDSGSPGTMLVTAAVQAGDTPTLGALLNVVVAGGGQGINHECSFFRCVEKYVDLVETI